MQSLVCLFAERLKCFISSCISALLLYYRCPNNHHLALVRVIFSSPTPCLANSVKQYKFSFKVFAVNRMPGSSSEAPARVPKIAGGFWKLGVLQGNNRRKVKTQIVHRTTKGQWARAETNAQNLWLQSVTNSFITHCFSYRKSWLRSGPSYLWKSGSKSQC